MIKRTIYSLIENRKLTLFFVFLVIVSGVLGFIRTPKQESPEFSIPYAMITTVYPGASQADVDAYVTEPIIAELKQIDGYDTSFSYSSNSFSLVILELDFNSDIDASFEQLRDAMINLQSGLPEGCGIINVNTEITKTAGVLISLSSEELDNAGVSGLAEYVGNEILEIEGIDNYKIIGKLDEEITVRVDENKMMAAGLTLSQVSSIVKAGGTDIPIGKLDSDEVKGVLDYRGSYSSVDEIKNLAIGYNLQADRTIYLKDIADISLGTSTSNTYYKHNGINSVIIAAYFKDDTNILPLKKLITEKLDETETYLPPDVETSLIISQPSEIDSSLANFAKNLMIAVGLVILVVLIGMGFRNALVVSVSLPLSILISFGVMYLLDIRIHQVSIAALIVCLGMLVDNSIVVSDSIQGHLDRGMKREKACMRGVRDVASPVFASTVTTVAAFLPFLFLNSIAGDYIKSLPQIVCISLAASYITAMFIIPVFGYLLFKGKKRKKGLKKRKKYFIRLLKGSMKRKTLVLAVVVLLVAGTVFLAFQLDTVFFPASDKNIIYIDIRNNKGDDLNGTIELVTRIESVIGNEEVVTEYTSAAGSGLPRFNQIMFVYTKTPDIGQIMMRIDLSDSSFKTKTEYKDHLQSKLDSLDLDAKISVKQLMYAFPMDEDLIIRITGENPDNLKIYENQIYEKLLFTEGLINVNRSNSDYVTEFDLDINEEALSNLGMQKAQVLNEISIAMLGRNAAVILSDKNKIPITVTSEATDPGNVNLATAVGGYVEGNKLLKVEPVQKLSMLPRFKGEYSMSVTADYDLDYDKGELLKEIKDDIEAMGIGDANIIYEGEDELIRENFGQIGILGIIALAVVYIILLVQFKSFAMPLLIFITIPLSAIGSVAGLYITGQAVSFTALLGIVSLLGIVVNNAIILIDYIKKEKETGISTKKACINASRRRMRPILLSTITTVIGLIPLAISTSQLFKPMAIALMSGLIVSTMLTLIVLPVFVSMFPGIKQK